MNKFAGAALVCALLFVGACSSSSDEQPAPETQNPTWSTDPKTGWVLVQSGRGHWFQPADVQISMGCVGSDLVYQSLSYGNVVSIAVVADSKKCLE